MELVYLRSSVDTCLFYHSKKNSFIAVYVDDMIIFDVDEISVQKLIANLSERVRIEDKGIPLFQVFRDLAIGAFLFIS